MLTCPLMILTLGLFTFVINAVILLLTSALAGRFGLGFHVDGFWPAFWGALVVSIVSVLLSIFVREPDPAAAPEAAVLAKLLSLVGATLVLVAYAAQPDGAARPAGLCRTSLLNLAGGGILTFFAVRARDPGLMLMEGSWVVISLGGMSAARAGGGGLAGPRGRLRSAHEQVRDAVRVVLEQRQLLGDAA